MVVVAAAAAVVVAAAAVVVVTAAVVVAAAAVVVVATAVPAPAPAPPLPPLPNFGRNPPLNARLWRYSGLSGLYGWRATTPLESVPWSRSVSGCLSLGWRLRQGTNSERSG